MERLTLYMGIVHLGGAFEVSTTRIQGNMIVCVCAVHELSHGTLYKLLANRQVVYYQVTCRMCHFFHAQMIMLPCHQQQKLPRIWSA